MKKKFVVPIDFSITSRHAYDYARKLAEVYQADLELVHVYSGSINPNEPLIIRQGKGIAEVLQDQLDELAGDLPPESNANIGVHTRLIQGFTTKALLAISQEEATTMMIIGATGAGGALDKLLGSVSSAIAQRAECPVLIIPKGSTYSTYKNIVYASNYESADQIMLRRLLDFNNTFKAALHFVHINEQEDDYDTVESKIFEEVFDGVEPTYSVHMDRKESDSVLQGIFDYAAAQAAELIVLVNRQRSWWDSIIGASLTKNSVLTSKVPLLIYHL